MRVSLDPVSDLLLKKMTKGLRRSVDSVVGEAIQTMWQRYSDILRARGIDEVKPKIKR